ncbi:hypothetical protein BGZ95_010825 [Linnemannia exigua]|uniref:Magnesium transport protein CorA n=1 Tax=Linnemannia exigua TaxID=604196 RepID=A0AAD4DM74_9FUNG|nr:hypothetical protein BGZ95_010825 [Linnemannia exigua]
MNIHDVVDTHPHGYQHHSTSSTSKSYGLNSHNYRKHGGSTTSTSSSASSLKVNTIKSNQQQQEYRERGSVSQPIELEEPPISPDKMMAAARRTQTFPVGSSTGLKGTLPSHPRRILPKLAVRGQGVDVSNMDNVFNCIEQQVSVTVVDVSPTEYKARNNLNNGQFLEWLKLPRPDWSVVRWININGMSWDVIKAIATEYDIHHLAVEDLLHVPQRTKVDLYPKQTYISCTLLTLMERIGEGESRQVDAFTNPHGIDPDFLSQRLPLEQLDSYKHYHYSEEENYEDLHVEMEQVTLLLLEAGTLITLFQVSGQSVVAPIVERLSHDYSLVRKHGDASFLLQSVMDGIVDQAVPIADAFRHEINNLEARVLALPKMMFTRELHRVTSQLSMLKRTIVPTQMLVHSLRGKDERSPLSPLARTYMGDVMDHCNTMVEDIDTMLSLCEKLINMIFNLIAYDTNESMRRLALVTIIFLPITFVAGVYGTNFQDFPELTHNIGYFWMICGIVFAMFLAAIVGEWVYNQWKAKSVEKRLKRKDLMTIGQNRQGRSLSRRLSSHLLSNPSPEPYV